MSIYINDIPYLITQNKKISLPRYDNNKKMGFGSLVFLFTNNTGESIQMINNKETCTHDGRYPYYYYNRRYGINFKDYLLKDILEKLMGEDII